MEDKLILGFASLGLVILVCQWLGWRLRIPAILFLMIAGLLVGPVFGIFHPLQTFGPLFHPMIVMAVAIILFEGGLSLRFKEIRGVEHVIRNLLTIGVLVTAILSAITAHFILRFPWEYAILFGTIMTVSGPTVILPMLRTIQPKQRIADILRWEGVMVDPIGVILSVLVFTTIMSLHHFKVVHNIMVHFGLTIGIGLAAGFVAGRVFGYTIKHKWIPYYLQTIATLIVVTIVYSMTQLYDEAAGLLAVTIMGVTMANIPRIRLNNIRDFKQSIGILLVSGLFFILAAHVQAKTLASIGWLAVGVAFLHQFVIRPVIVWLSTIGSKLNWREKLLIAWIGPKGIVSAATAAIFAMVIPDKTWTVSQLSLSVFIVIFVTVAFQSTTSRWLAQRLKVTKKPTP